MKQDQLYKLLEKDQNDMCLMTNYPIRLCLLICMVVLVQFSMAQKISLPILSLDSEALCSKIDSLVKVESRCSNFDTTLYWQLSGWESGVNNNLGFRLTQSGYVDDCYGAFVRGGLVFYVINENEFLQRIFGLTDDKLMIEFDTLEGEPEFFPGDDYSTWFFQEKNGMLTIVEAYPINCD